MVNKKTKKRIIWTSSLIVGVLILAFFGQNAFVLMVDKPCDSFSMPGYDCNVINVGTGLFAGFCDFDCVDSDGSSVEVTTTVQDDTPDWCSNGEINSPCNCYSNLASGFYSTYYSGYCCEGQYSKISCNQVNQVEPTDTCSYNGNTICDGTKILFCDYRNDGTLNFIEIADCSDSNAICNELSKDFVVCEVEQEESFKDGTCLESQFGEDRCSSEDIEKCLLNFQTGAFDWEFVQDCSDFGEFAKCGEPYNNGVIACYIDQSQVEEEQEIIDETEPECTSNNDCALGWGCQNNKCENLIPNDNDVVIITDNGEIIEGEGEPNEDNCLSAWKIGIWSNCVNGVRIRTVEDMNKCDPPTGTKLASEEKCDFILGDEETQPIIIDGIKTCKAYQELKNDECKLSFKVFSIQGLKYLWKDQPGVIIGIAFLILAISIFLIPPKTRKKIIPNGGVLSGK